MIPKQTVNLLRQSVQAALNDSDEVLRRAKMSCAEKSVQRGLRGQVAINAQILAVYEEYKRRAEIVAACIDKVVSESSFRHDRQLDNDLQGFFLDQCANGSRDIDANLKKMPSDGKPSFDDFKIELHQKLLAKISLVANAYQAQHPSWWVAHGIKTLKWGMKIATALLIAWLIRGCIE